MTTFPASKETIRQQIAQEIEDTLEAYYIFPHLAMVPDFFLRYWDLAEACCEYFDIPFHKPTLSTIDKTDSKD